MYRSSELKVAIGLGLSVLFLSAPLCLAQDRDRDRDRDRGTYTRLEPGTVIPVRMNQAIDVERRDNRVYYGTVDQTYGVTMGESRSLGAPMPN